ncbi:MAG: GNAT family N-acetyltransferase [Chloroflexi bacterium]|nr:GNAT family N-acetyltransferase [Chloroflexota bacterium]
MTTQLLTYLPWDSAHFGFRIARALPRRLDANTYRQLVDACQDQSIECLYFLADASHPTTILTLQANHFDFIDIRLILAGRIRNIPSPPLADNIQFRLGHEGDLAPLLPIAETSYTMSRFYVDPRFGSDKAALMFQIWLEKSLTTDFADAVIVAELAGIPVGFVTCHFHKPADEVNVGLVGLAESTRGMGVASGMMAYVRAWVSTQGFDRLNAATQGSNIGAQRLHQRGGLMTRSVDLWFHKWFTSLT